MSVKGQDTTDALERLEEAAGSGVTDRLHAERRRERAPALRRFARRVLDRRPAARDPSRARRRGRPLLANPGLTRHRPPSRRRRRASGADRRHLHRARLRLQPRADVARWKYAKLLRNSPTPSTRCSTRRPARRRSSGAPVAEAVAALEAAGSSRRRSGVRRAPPAPDHASRWPDARAPADPRGRAWRARRDDRGRSTQRRDRPARAPSRHPDAGQRALARTGRATPRAAALARTHTEAEFLATLAGATPRPDDPWARRGPPGARAEPRWAPRSLTSPPSAPPPRKDRRHDSQADRQGRSPDARHEEREALGTDSRAIDLIELALLGKHLHWNLTGPDFQELHEHLDVLVAEWQERADVTAERAEPRGRPGTLRAVASESQLTEVEAGEVRTDNRDPDAGRSAQPDDHASARADGARRGVRRRHRGSDDRDGRRSGQQRWMIVAQE